MLTRMLGESFLKLRGEHGLHREEVDGCILLLNYDSFDGRYLESGTT